jgi:NitT/TauT family transport system substrate-binding protein
MKKILFIIIVLLCSMRGHIYAAERLERLVITGPPVSETYPLLRMSAVSELREIADKIKFIPWHSTDQLRAMIAANQVDFVVLTTVSAANLYNKGVEIRVVDVFYPSSTWIISADLDVHSLKDLKGAEVVLPFRPGDMPEIILSAVISRQGLAPRRDIRFRYVGSPMDAVQLMLLRRARHAFLSEPAVSMAILRSASIGKKVKAPLLRKSIDMQYEWGQAYPECPLIPLAAIAVVGNRAASPEVVLRFRKAYKECISWCLKHPEETGKQAAALFPGLRTNPVALNIKETRYRMQAGTEARKNINFFLSVLKSKNPACIGGKLPDEKFIWTAP